MYVFLYLVVAEKRESLYLIQVVFQSIWRIRFLHEPQGEYLGICYLFSFFLHVFLHTEIGT